jgi:hypothetical protein
MAGTPAPVTGIIDGTELALAAENAGPGDQAHC